MAHANMKGTIVSTLSLAGLAGAVDTSDLFNAAVQSCRADDRLISTQCCLCCVDLVDFFVFSEATAWCQLGCLFSTNYIHAEKSCTDFSNPTQLNNNLRMQLCSHGETMGVGESFQDPFFQGESFTCSSSGEIEFSGSSSNAEEEIIDIDSVSEIFNDSFFIGFLILILTTGFLIVVLLVFYKDKMFQLEQDVRTRIRRLKKLPPNGLTAEDKLEAETEAPVMPATLTKRIST